jgi:hypothetical protein
MGFIRNIIKELDQSSELEREATAHLEALEDLASAKADLFEATLKTNLVNAGTGSDKTIPISQIEDFTKDTRAYVASNADNITTAVNEAINGFVQGGKEQVVGGIEKLLTVAITALFGADEGTESTTAKYYVANEGISLVRIDLMGWKRSAKAVSLTTKIEQVSAFVLCKSTIDIERTSFDTFLDVYQGVIMAGNPNASPQTIIKEARELFEAFTKKTKEDAALAHA